jgi:D-alanyl-lipoteichoic acid acyltransferase DltB (MBOAT superfamily)
MLFNTFEFWIFFTFVLAGVHLLPHRGQNRLLLIASYYFYGCWDWRFLSLLLISTILDFYAAPLAAPGRPRFVRKLALTASVVGNLGMLGFFKYWNFFMNVSADLLSSYATIPDAFFLNIILPVGISFYTFQTMSYTFDVYNGDLKPIDSLEDFALYVSFFPQLVAGPIERGARLIPQVINPRRINPDRMESSLYLIAWGLFKKVIVADTVAHPVNAVFAAADPTGPEVYLATIGFAAQIYCDFSGYTDIALGTARLLGFDLMLNFNLPYFARSPSDFWRRWHISLSTFLRDYLYIPLGGNRHGKWTTYRNLLITMVLGGLWHGAGYNFLLWGLYHGLLLIIQRVARDLFPQNEAEVSRFAKIVQVVGMFHLTLLGWLLFRVENMSQLDRMIRGFLDSWDYWQSAGEIAMYMAPAIVPLVLFEIWQFCNGRLEVVASAPFPIRAAFLGLTISAVLLLNRSGNMPFIYFQF